MPTIHATWTYNNNKREIVSLDKLPVDSQLGCAFAVPFFDDGKSLRPIIIKHAKRWREFPWWRRDPGETHMSNLVREIREEAWITSFEYCELVCGRKFYNPADFVMPWSWKYESESYCTIYALVTSHPLLDWTAPHDEIIDVAIVNFDDDRLLWIHHSNKVIYDLCLARIKNRFPKK